MFTRALALGATLTLAAGVVARPASAVPATPAAGAPRSATAPTADDLGGLVVPDSNYAIPTGALYVDATKGADTNKGTLAAPFATLGHAVSLAKAGATIVLRAGTYREALGLLRRKITIQAYPHEQVWLSGSVVVSTWTHDLADRPDGAVWEHTGWATQFCQTCFDPRAIDPAYPNAGKPDMVFVNGRPLAQVASLAAVRPGTFYVSYAKQALYIGDDPTVAGTTVEASNKTYAMEFSAGASGSSLLGVGVEQYASYENTSPIPAMVFTTGGASVIFDRDVFAYSASRGLTLYGANAVVTNSLFVNNGYTGLHGDKADNVDVANNFVAGNNYEHFWAGFSPAAAASGIKFTTTANAIVRNNIVQDNHANGIWFDISSYNPTIVDNLTRGNERNGIYVEITGHGVVASNLSVDNGQAGIKLSGATFTRVYNNTLADNLTYQLSVHDDGRVDTNRTFIGEGITWITASNQLMNNILAAPAAGSIGPLLYTEDLDNPKIHDASTMITAMDGNVYARATSKLPSSLAQWTRIPPTAIAHYANIKMLRAGTGYDMNSIEYIGYTTSPVFKDPGAGDYSLLATSPALASGQPLPSDIAAAVGVPVTNTPNRGALVYPLIANAPPTP